MSGTVRTVSRERGAALISALLLVALMTTVAMALATDLRFSMRRTANLEIRDQAYWYALGARDFAEISIERAMSAPDQALRPDAEWLNGPQIFPIDQGQLAGTVTDGNNCFNLNSLVVRGEDGVLREVAAHRHRYEILMRAAGLPAQEVGRISAQTLDWIDSDVRQTISGGEDELYSDLSRAYRTGNTLLAEPQELLALEAMTPDLFRVLEPLVCTRPMTDPLSVNINTLRADQLPLLIAALDGNITQVEADGLLLRRPPAGFEQASEFWELNLLENLELTDEMRGSVGITTNYFEIEIDVLYAGMRFELNETVEWRGGGSLRRLTQRYGSFS
ncbi:type II secretion system minor pseudopilin GspK [Maricaulis sp.]|uniref:type II secretion system minor pseudopilin GspK n=1 Tax=Maricaulis sp. TaxID=1486257 RepID=UPI00260ECB08|nr:type II secretion system minor pseudopilin GspK [Maricaulis sp.]